MISNLAAKSNLLPRSSYQEHFDRLSAIDLRNIHDRFPLLGISFDPSHYSLTPDQQAEWEAHLFWGEKRVRMRDDNRQERWILELYQGLARHWDQLLEYLDSESALEALWILKEASTCQKLNQEELGRIDYLFSYLQEQGHSRDAIDYRLQHLTRKELAT